MKVIIVGGVAGGATAAAMQIVDFHIILET